MFSAPPVIQAQPFAGLPEALRVCDRTNAFADAVTGWADRSRSREAVVAAACASMALGLASAAFLLSSPWALVCLCLTMIGFYGFVAPFWTLPSAFLTGASAAAGIALINVVGNLANYAGPALLGRISDVTRSYGTGLRYLAAVAAGAAGIMAVQAVCKRRT